MPRIADPIARNVKVWDSETQSTPRVVNGGGQRRLGFLA
jgi:hypothetical protein